MCWEILKPVCWKKFEGNNPKKGILKLVNALAALADFFLPVVLFKKEKLLFNRTCKIAAGYEQICFLFTSCPRIFPPLFIHNFSRQLGRNTSLFFYFHGLYEVAKQINQLSQCVLATGDRLLLLVGKKCILSELL